MTRLLATLVALIVALLGQALCAEPAPAVAAPAAQAHPYNGYYETAVLECDTADRAPPAAPATATTPEAVGHGSRGALASSYEPTPCAATTDDGPATFAQVAQGVRATEWQRKIAEWTRAVFAQAGVAANGGRRAAPNCLTNSFTGDTLVLMADGTKKPIKDVKLGDKVIATDPVTGKQGPRKVVDLIRHGGLHTMVAVQLSDETTIDATDRHPFWVESQNAWVDAIDLEPGDVLVAADGSRRTVLSVGISEQDLTAFNLTVAGLHTYHVSAAEILVHNCKWPKPTDDNCAACAREIQDMIGGDIVHVRPTGGPRMGPSTNNPGGSWAEHYVVVRDGRVYDGFTGPSGMSIPDYKAQFQYADDINFGF